MVAHGGSLALLHPICGNYRVQQDQLFVQKQTKKQTRAAQPGGGRTESQAFMSCHCSHASILGPGIFLGQVQMVLELDLQFLPAPVPFTEERKQWYMLALLLEHRWVQAKPMSFSFKSLCNVQSLTSQSTLSLPLYPRHDVLDKHKHLS
jgi:hypothetical protein